MVEDWHCVITEQGPVWRVYVRDAMAGLVTYECASLEEAQDLMRDFGSDIVLK
jgi:hypothetical protein